MGGETGENMLSSRFTAHGTEEMIDWTWQVVGFLG